MLGVERAHYRTAITGDTPKARLRGEKSLAFDAVDDIRREQPPQQIPRT